MHYEVDFTSVTLMVPDIPSDSDRFTYDLLETLVARERIFILTLFDTLIWHLPGVWPNYVALGYHNLLVYFKQ